MQKRILISISILAALAVVVAWTRLPGWQIGSEHKDNTGALPDDEISLTAADSPSQLETANLATWHDLAYGSAPLEKLDVYAPPAAANAPVIVMVHGGGWQIGDKANRNVVDHKVSHFVPQGYVLVSINYPMLPEARPDEQANAVAAALQYVQQHAADWGGDPANMIVMGHSAGGHLVSLLSATREQYPALARWRGSVILDGAGYNIVERMGTNPSDVYRNAFGDDPAYWEEVSPHYQLQRAGEPLLLICSTKRRQKISCGPAEAFAQKVVGLGGSATVYPVALSHEEINATLGEPSDYTSAVDTFITEITQ